MSAGFARLSPALQYHIVNSLGWPALRPVQTQTTEAVLDGNNCIVLAPTAGGKTEAAFFPLLSRIDVEDLAPVSVIYLSPIRALLNNQEERIGDYARMIGRTVFKWHGDVSESLRKRFREEPADVLLTTPEALEAMLMSSRNSAKAWFANLRAVVIDEVHAFAGDDRGGHLSCVLERLVRLAESDVQRIGLSATVGNPVELLEWLAGSSKRQGRVVDPGGARKSPQLAVDFVGDIERAAVVIEQLHRGKKRLVFADSRRVVEELGDALHQRGVDTHVIHGSLSAPRRHEAEHAFAEGEDCVIVATSALELGIDVGDLDHVLQIDAPTTVASFLQRMGRTGRRGDTPPNCTFLATSDRALLVTAGLLRLFADGYVEPVRPNYRAGHLYAHQVMALCIQTGGVAEDAIDSWLMKGSPVRELSPEEKQSILCHMLSTDVLAKHDNGRLWLGAEGEQRFGRANFRKLYAAFESPREFEVRWATRSLGTVAQRFLLTVVKKDEMEGPAAFMLGGRPWQVMHVDFDRGVVEVKPAEHANAPRWLGAPRHLSRHLCQAIKRVLVEDEAQPYWSARARSRMESLRAEHAFVRDEEPCGSWIDDGAGVRWWNFAGGAANVLLAQMLESELGERVSSSNLYLKLSREAAPHLGRAREFVTALGRAGRPNVDDGRRFAKAAVRGSVSKFESCLPEVLLLELWSRSVLDVGGACAATAGG